MQHGKIDRLEELVETKTVHLQRYQEQTTETDKCCRVMAVLLSRMSYKVKGGVVRLRMRGK